MWLTRAGRRASTVFLFGWASTSGGPHCLTPSPTVRWVGRCQELHRHMGALVHIGVLVHVGMLVHVGVLGHLGTLVHMGALMHIGVLVRAGTLMQDAVGRAKQHGGVGGLLSAPRLLQKVSSHQGHQLGPPNGSQSQDGQWEGAELRAHVWDSCTAWFVGRSAPGLWKMR